MVNKYHNKEYVKSGSKPKGSVRQKAKISQFDPKKIAKRSKIYDFGENTMREVMELIAVTAGHPPYSRTRRALQRGREIQRKLERKTKEVRDVNEMLEEKYPAESFPANIRKKKKKSSPKSYKAKSSVVKMKKKSSPKSTQKLAGY